MTSSCSIIWVKPTLWGLYFVLVPFKEKQGEGLQGNQSDTRGQGFLRLNTAVKHLPIPRHIWTGWLMICESGGTARQTDRQTACEAAQGPFVNNLLIVQDLEETHVYIRNDNSGFRSLLAALEIQNRCTGIYSPPQVPFHCFRVLFHCSLSSSSKKILCSSEERNPRQMESVKVTKGEAQLSTDTSQTLKSSNKS